MDQERVDIGRKLLTLKQDPYFEIFMNEINDRIERYKEMVLTYDGGPKAGDLGAAYYRPRYQELMSIVNWLDEQIHLGEREINLDRESKLQESTNE